MIILSQNLFYKNKTTLNQSIKILALLTQKNLGNYRSILTKFDNSKI